MLHFLEHHTLIFVKLLRKSPVLNFLNYIGPAIFTNVQYIIIFIHILEDMCGNT